MKHSLSAFTIAMATACADSGESTGNSSTQLAIGPSNLVSSSTSPTGMSVLAASSSDTGGSAATVGDTTGTTNLEASGTRAGGGTASSADTSGTISTMAVSNSSASSDGSISIGSTSTSGGGTTTSGDIDSAEGASNSTGGARDAVTTDVLVFSRTTGYRHESIEVGVQALKTLATQRGWSLVATEDPSVFVDTQLTSYNVIVFLNTNDEVLNDTQQAAMEEFIRAGNGYVGVHSAAATEYDWSWYGRLVGAYLDAHPDVQPATIVVDDANHPATAHLSETWTRTDEWYGFTTNPRDNVHVLLSLEEQSYAAGVGAMGDDHPIAWYHEYDGGRAFFTGLGHTDESYTEPEFLQHLVGAIEWASGAWVPSLSE